MNFKKFLKKERIIWHNHFIASFVAALVVGFISYIFEMTFSNVILFASIGASAVILTNTKSHHLTRLHSTIVAYVIAIIISTILYYLNTLYKLNISLNIFLLVFFVGISLFLFDAFHPPAVTASISFIVLERSLMDLLYLFIAVIILFIILRFFIYIFSQHLSVKEFLQEFKKSF